MKRKIIAILLGCVMSGTLLAVAPNPMDMLQTVSNKMVQSLHQNRSKLKSNPKFVYGLVNQIIVPHADVASMSRAVLGPTVWNSSTNAQRSAFQKAFTRVVINTYESALNAYTNETIRFDPLRESYQDKKLMDVQSYVIRADGPPVSLNYKIVLRANQWKLFDLNVEGISMLQSFRAQIASQVSSGMNITQITNNLNQHNR